MKKVILSIVVVGALASCSIVKTTPRTLEVDKAKVMVKPMLAEIKVDVARKISGQAVSKLSEDLAKEQAKWNAIEKSGADMIVDPVYKTIQTGKSWNVTVTGFFGKYVKMQTASPQEIEEMQNLLPVPMKKEKNNTLKSLKLIK